PNAEHGAVHPLLGGLAGRAGAQPVDRPPARRHRGLAGLAGVWPRGSTGAAAVVRASQSLGLRRARLSRGARPGRRMTAEAQSRGASTPSGAPSAAGWPGLLLVSLFAVAICTALAWVPKVLGDPDTYWHIAAGEWILDH